MVGGGQILLLNHQQPPHHRLLPQNLRACGIDFLEIDSSDLSSEAVVVDSLYLIRTAILAIPAPHFNTFILGNSMPGRRRFDLASLIEPSSNTGPYKSKETR